MKRFVTLTIMAEEDEKIASAFSLLCRTAQDVDMLYPYISVTIGTGDDEEEVGEFHVSGSPGER